MGWKKLICGEKMPDKNNPKYKEIYSRDINAGKKVATFLKLDRLIFYTQVFAIKRPKMFIILVFGVVALAISYNIYQGIISLKEGKNNNKVWVKKLEKKSKEGKKTIKNISYEFK